MRSCSSANTAGSTYAARCTLFSRQRESIFICARKAARSEPALLFAPELDEKQISPRSIIVHGHIAQVVIGARHRRIERRQLALQPIDAHAEQPLGFVEERDMVLRALLVPGIGHPVLGVLGV